MCGIHSIPHDEYQIPIGADVDLAHLDALFSDNDYTALLINAHETSTGHLYDIESIGSMARRHNVFFLVDAISSICADPFFMDDWHVDAAILSSQKALGLPPGLSFIAMNQNALDRMDENKPRSMYFDFKDYLANQQRGQLPFTPAIGIMMQLHQRLLDIQKISLRQLTLEHEQRAESFRRAIADLAFAVLPSRPSNALTALSCEGLDACEVVEALRADYNIVVAPNGGDLRTRVFRVAHMGAQGENEISKLISALKHISLQGACETKKG